MFDPYPNEPMEIAFQIPDTSDLVYAPDRYTEANSPHAIYYPSKMCLFKIMRACIDIPYPEYLWFNMREDLVDPK